MPSRRGRRAGSSTGRSWSAQACRRGPSCCAAARLPVRWKIDGEQARSVDEAARTAASMWPDDLPQGVYGCDSPTRPATARRCRWSSAPPRAFAGDFDRGWLLAVQLYGVRSTRNWGMGDFTDLEDLIELASELGADGVGLNPLHALFDDRPGDCSPYSPNSRLFLNALYIDVENIPGLSADAAEADAIATAAPNRDRRLSRRRRTEMAGVARGLRKRSAPIRNAAAARRFRYLPRRARHAAVAFRLLRGAAAQIQDAMVGMAAGMAAAGRGALRETARRPRQRARSNSSSSCNGVPTASWAPARSSRTGSA